MILQTQRLLLREMQQSDFPDLCLIMQDPAVMQAYEGVFTDSEVQEWLDRQLYRYKDWGFGLWAVILKETGEMIGQCGVTFQPVPHRNDDILTEVGYLFRQSHWHQGYATEAAEACRDYAFKKLKEDNVYCIIRDTNTASQNLAKRLGMTLRKRFVKHYRGVDMPHLLYSITRRKWLEEQARRNLATARRIATELQIETLWKSAGAECYLVGSAKTGLMAWSLDIDYHVYTPEVSVEQSFEVMKKICSHPRVKTATFGNLLAAEDRCLEWHLTYEETPQRIWKIDLMHIHPLSPFAGMVERVTEKLCNITDRQRHTILQLKYKCAPPQPTIPAIPSICIYQAVIEGGVKTLDQFQQWLADNPQSGVSVWEPKE